MWVLTLITLGSAERVSIRGDIGDGPGDSHAVAFADAARRGWRLWRTPWLLWSPELVVLVRTKGRHDPELVTLWSGHHDAKPGIDTDTGVLTWADGSSLQLDLKDDAHRNRLFHQY